MFLYTQKVTKVTPLCGIKINERYLLETSTSCEGILCQFKLGLRRCYEVAFRMMLFMGF